MTKSTLNLVQLTDQHLFGDPQRLFRGIQTLPALRATLEAAADEITACDAILATGDLVNDDPGGYVHFRTEFAALGKPVLCVPGNHDDLPAMRAALSQPPFQTDGVFDAGRWRIVLLDSTIPGETGGALGPDRLAFLEQALVRAPQRHALICMHHHPIPMQSRWLDTVGVANGGEFLDLIDRFANVRAVVFGHVHQALDIRRKEVRMIATPSTSAQFKPRSDDFALDDQPPAWRSLTLHADGRIDTRLRWVHGWQRPMLDRALP